MFPTLLETIGQTPIIRLPIEAPCPILAKCEFMNPGGSIKDRPALYMINEAEKTGLLKPGGRIIEASSGNQGLALAMIGALKGYSVTIVTPSRISAEKSNALKAYGAHVVICGPNDPDYTEVARTLHQSTPGSFMPNQYYNLCNAEAHYHSTAPEIWQQTAGKLTHAVLAMGSCGTVNGISRYLKEQNPDIKIIGVDSEKSLRTLGYEAPYAAEGIGVDVLEGGLFGAHFVDDIITVSDEEAFEATQSLAKHGLLFGIATGATVHTIKQLASTFTPEDTVLTLITDSGRNYLSKVFADEASHTTTSKVLEYAEA